MLESRGFGGQIETLGSKCSSRRKLPGTESLVLTMSLVDDPLGGYW